MRSIPCCRRLGCIAKRTAYQPTRGFATPLLCGRGSAARVRARAWVLCAGLPVAAQWGGILNIMCLWDFFRAWACPAGHKQGRKNTIRAHYVNVDHPTGKAGVRWLCAWQAFAARCVGLGAAQTTTPGLRQQARIYSSVEDYTEARLLIMLLKAYSIAGRYRGALFFNQFF